MSTAIVRHEVTGIDDLQRLARLLATSNYFDAKAAGGETAIAQIATKILAGAEMGYGPFASVQGIHVIQGKPVISANLMAAAVKRSGRYDYRVRRLDNDGCELEFFQRNAEKFESIGKTAFTRDDAKAAGLLGKDNWSKFARNMFFARAMSNGIRFFCPDVFDGSAVYTPDELGADEDADGNVIDVQPTTVTQEVRPTNGKPAAPAAPSAASNSGGSQTSNGNGGGAVGGTVRPGTLKRLHVVGMEWYGSEWDAKRHELVAAISKGRTESSKELTEAEAAKLVAGIESKIAAQHEAVDAIPPMQDVDELEYATDPRGGEFGAK